MYFSMITWSFSCIFYVIEEVSCLQTKDLQWYFFCPKVRKYPKGNRENRVTPQGRWKPSGKDRSIFSGKRLAGTRKCLIYYDRRSKKEERTDWVMHEFRLTDEESQRFKTNQVAFVYFLLLGSVKFS